MSEKPLPPELEEVEGREQPPLTGRQIIDEIIREYGEEVFISEGYAAGDALESAIDAAIDAAIARSIPCKAGQRQKDGSGTGICWCCEQERQDCVWTLYRRSPNDSTLVPHFWCQECTEIMNGFGWQTHCHVESEDG